MVEPGKNRNAQRLGRITRNTALAREVRSNRAYLSATRNPYGAPPEAYTGSETPDSPPPQGSQRRWEWDKKIGKLRLSGMSYVDIAAEMNTTENTVRAVCRHHGFTKGS
jgi:DNA-binding NarL/FixJ family response regulator